MKASNKKLHLAKEAKNDEFYTQLVDVKEVVENYKEHLKNKVIYLPCDNPKDSNFYQYLKDNYDRLGIKKIIATYLNGNKTVFSNGMEEEFLLNGNGSFDSEECLEILKDCDVVLTNPPFSILHDIVNYILEENKDFILFAPNTYLCRQAHFELINAGKVKIDVNSLLTNKFLRRNHQYKAVNCFIINSFKTNKEKKKREKKKRVNDDGKYFDETNIINYDLVASIDRNYKGIMAVPVTFLLTKYEKEYNIIQYYKGKINGKYKFSRILIQKKEG